MFSLLKSTKIRQIFIWLGIVLVSLCCFYLLAIWALPLATPYVQQHRNVLEKWASEAMRQPIKIQSVGVKRDGLIPVVSFSSVTMLNDAATATIAKIDQIDIGIDIYKSLMHLKVESGFVAISGTRLSFIQSVDGSVLLAGMDPSSKVTVTLDDVLEWFFTQNEVYLRSMQIDWHGNTGTNFTLQFSNLQLYPGAEMRKAELLAQESGIKGIAPAIISFVVKLPPHAIQFQLSPDKTFLMEWLNQVFAEENVLSGSLSLYGLVRNIAANQRQPLSIFRLKNVDFNYLPGWPKIEGLDVDLFYDGKSLNAVASSGFIDEVPIPKIRAEIVDLEKPILSVTGETSTNMEDLLEVLQNSPFKKSLEDNFAGIIGTGDFRLFFGLSLPLFGENNQAQLSGRFVLLGDDVSLPNFGLDFKNLHGELRFFGDSFVARNVSGSLFGQPTNLHLTTLFTKGGQYQGLQVKAESRMELKVLEKKFLSPVFGFLRGATNYEALLSLYAAKNRQNDSLQINSDLSNLEVNLPQPLFKNSLDKVPLQMLFNFKDKQIKNLRIDYGKRLNVVIAFVGQALDVSGSLERANVNEWRDYYNKYLEANALLNEPVSFVLNFNSLVHKAVLNIGELNIFDHILKPVQLNILPNHKTSGFTVHIVSPQLQGDLVWAENRAKSFFRGKFAEIDLSKKSGTFANFSPREIIPFDVSIDDLRYEGIKFGGIRLSTEPFIYGLRIKQLSFNSQVASMQSTGEWGIGSNGGQWTNLQGSFISQNWGDFLKSLDLGNNLDKGQGNASFAVNWRKALFSPDINTVQGSIKLKVEKGHIVSLGQKIEGGLGFGKFLNVLSLQALPNYLTMEFGDLTKKGFVFKVLSGDIQLKNGNVFLQNMDMNGVVAHVTATGRIGIKRKDYDLKLSTVPNITASLPIATVITSGPVIGAFVWLADTVFSFGLKKATTFVYYITGSWANPKVSRTVQKK